jgi:two-component system, cell cycle response regulator
VADPLTRLHAPGPRAAAPAEGFRLVFTRGEGLAGLAVPLDREVTLGRDPACDVVLRGGDVSRRHARVVPRDGGHLLVDLGSTNGTFVNGARVETVALAPGDRITLGGAAARYLRAGETEERDLADLAALARVDPLTGLANRRAFDEALAAAVARAHRAAAPLSVVALDVDHFKRVNDAHGHAAGDAVLRELAARARAALREGDLLARVGGEELAALLPGEPLEGAADAAERLRAAVAAAPFAAGTAALPVTISAGCAALEPGDRDGGALLARADARLYEAKRSGRNRVA